MTNKPKVKTMWGVFQADGITLRGPIIADDVCETLSEAFAEAATLIQDGTYKQVEIAKARFSQKHESWVDMGEQNRIQSDARDFEIDEDED